MSIHVELNDLMTRKGYSQTQVAVAIGKSTAVINQYLQGKYAGDVPAIDALARSFINREVEKEKSQKITARFVPTVTSRKGMDVIRYAHLDGDLNVIYGAAGLGKTMILREYAAQHRDALLIEADPGYTARVVLEELCGLLGISKRGNMHELSEACIAALRDSGRLLMVDEAENLPYRALETLRRIHDKSGIGLVLAGMPRLIINLKGKRGEYQQLYSRVGFALCIGDSLPQSDITDIAVSMLLVLVARTSARHCLKPAMAMPAGCSSWFAVSVVIVKSVVMLSVLVRCVSLLKCSLIRGCMAIIEISVSRRGKGVQVRTRMVRNDDDSELVRNTAKRIHMSLGDLFMVWSQGYSQRLKIYRHPRQIKTIFTNPWSGVAMCRLPINDQK